MKIKSVVLYLAALMVIPLILISCISQEKSTVNESNLTIERILDEHLDDKTQELNAEITELKSQIQELNDEITKLQAKVYKNSWYGVFYGEWEANGNVYIDPVPVRGYPYTDDELKAIIEAESANVKGNTLKFTPENAVINGDKVIDNIKYDFTIFPADDNYDLHFTMTLKDIGLTESEGNYYVFVETWSEEHSSFYGSDFFIKDKNTLIVRIHNGVYIEYTRASYDGGLEVPVIISG